MAAYGLSFSRLRESADEIQAGKSELLSIFGEYKSHLMGLDADWESEAHEEFKQELAKIEANLESYGKVLNDFSAHLIFAADEYKARDVQAAADVRVLDSSKLFKF